MLMKLNCYLAHADLAADLAVAVADLAHLAVAVAVADLAVAVAVADLAHLAVADSRFAVDPFLREPHSCE